MTPREIAIIRACPEPSQPYVDKAIVFVLAFDHHGINKMEAMEILTRLCESGHISRMKKRAGVYNYRRTEQGQAAIAQGVAA